MAEMRPLAIYPTDAVPVREMKSGDVLPVELLATALSLQLTGLNKTDPAVITAVDTILGALGKLQAQASNKVDKDGTKVLSDNNFTNDERVKLANVADAATKNAGDAALRDRATHTGVQLLATISDAGTAAAANLISSPSDNSPGLVLTTDSELISDFSKTSPRNFPDGCLIRTNLPYEEDVLLLAEIKGNSYGEGSAPFNLVVQGYIYHESWITTKALIQNFPTLKSVTLLNLNGFIAIWLTSIGYYTGFQARVTDQRPDRGVENHVRDLVQAALPTGATHIVSVPVQSTLSNANTLNGGAVIESGVNENGRYTKFYDGTMICTRRIDVYAAGVAYHYMPAAFVGDVFPSLSVTPHSGVWGGLMQCYAESTIWIVNAPSNGGANDLKLTAIGRWK